MGDSGLTTLSARDREMLDFEESWWRLPGARETAVREQFSVSPTRYHQEINRLIDRPEALAAYPLLVRRLRRRREERRRRRALAR